MNKLTVLAAVGALVSTAALAQTTPPATPAANPHPATPAAAPASNEGLRQQMMADLQKAGFTNVTVRPDSFLVQAKDKSGTPVTMLIDPNSVTEVVAMNGQGTGQGSATANGTQAAVPAGGTFTTIPGSDMLGSKVIGMDVHNNANQDIGTIKDVAYANGGVKAYIVGVGGFLGMGDHYVAVNPAAVHMSYDAGNKTWHATMNTTADQLKAAPEFKYPT